MRAGPKHRIGAVVAAAVAVVSSAVVGAAPAGAEFPVIHISGTVLAADGHPLGLVSVTAYAADGSYDLGSDYSDQGTGEYSLSLQTGFGNDFLVCFDPTYADIGPAEPGYEPQCYDQVDWDGSSTPSGTVVHATAQAPATGIDAHLQPTAGIAGRLFAGSNVPVHGEGVALYRAGSPPWAPPVATTGTDIDGRYSFPVVDPGSYVVCFSDRYGFAGPSPGGYFDECWDDVATVAEATPIVLGQQEFRTGVNARLTPAGGITGTVTAASTGAKLSSVDVTAFDPDGNRVGVRKSDYDPGGYVIGGLTPGVAYTVCVGPYTHSTSAYPTGLRPQCYQDVDWKTPLDGPDPGATAVTTTAGSVRSHVDFALETGGAVRGRVTLPGTYQNGTSVDLYDRSGRLVATAGTTELRSGQAAAYTVSGLPPGGYSVCFDNVVNSYSGLSECYSDQPWTGPGSPIPAGRTRVDVRANQAVAHVDATLEESGVIDGEVTDAAGDRIYGTTAVVVTGSGAVVARVLVDTAYFELNLPASTSGHVVCIDPRNATFPGQAQYLPQCFRKKAWDGDVAHVPTGTTRIPVVTGTHSTPAAKFVLLAANP